jgi:hypothetical protein
MKYGHFLKVLIIAIGSSCILLLLCLLVDTFAFHSNSVVGKWVIVIMPLLLIALYLFWKIHLLKNQYLKRRSYTYSLILLVIIYPIALYGVSKIVKNDDYAGPVKSNVEFIVPWHDMKVVNSKINIQLPFTDTLICMGSEVINESKTYVTNVILNAEKRDHPNLHYQVTYFSLNRDLSDQEIERVFNQQRDIVLTANNVKLVGSQKIGTLQYPSKEFIYSVDDSVGVITQRVFYFERKLYKVAVITNASNYPNKFITKFVNSFSIDE